MKSKVTVCPAKIRLIGQVMQNEIHHITLYRVKQGNHLTFIYFQEYIFIIHFQNSTIHSTTSF